MSCEAAIDLNVQHFRPAAQPCRKRCRITGTVSPSSVLLDRLHPGSIAGFPIELVGDN